MPKKGKGDKGDKGEKEKLPSELEQTLLTRVNALQAKFDQQVRAAEDAIAGHQAAKDALNKERADRKDNVDYLQAELAKKQAELNTLQEKYVELEKLKEEKEKMLKDELRKAKDTIAQQESSLEQLRNEVATRGDQLVELGNLKTRAAADVNIKGEMTSELEDLRLKLHESHQQLTVLAVADGREGGEEGERVLPLLLLEVLRLHPNKPVLAEQAMIALQYVLSSDRHADAELIRIRGGVDLILDVMSRHEAAADLQSAACGLLWKIVFADTPVRETIVDAHGIAHIMGAMQRHSSHPRLHYNACGALRHLLVTAPRNFPISSQLMGRGSAEALPPITAPDRKSVV